MDGLSPFRKINIAKGVGCQEERGIHGNGWGACPPALFRAGGNKTLFSFDDANHPDRDGANRPYRDSTDNRDRDSSNHPDHDIYNTRSGLISRTIES